MREIAVYWRPGCPFCRSLLRQLDRRDVHYRRIDIWSDPEAAAHVRSVANGNETVPTVTIGGQSLVNPDVHAVLALASDLAPHLVPADYAPPEPGRLRRWMRAKLSGPS